MAHRPSDVNLLRKYEVCMRLKFSSRTLVTKGTKHDFYAFTTDKFKRRYKITIGSDNDNRSHHVTQCKARHV